MDCAKAGSSGGDEKEFGRLSVVLGVDRSNSSSRRASIEAFSSSAGLVVRVCLVD